MSLSSSKLLESIEFLIINKMENKEYHKDWNKMGNSKTSSSRDTNNPEESIICDGFLECFSRRFKTFFGEKNQKKVLKNSIKVVFRVDPITHKKIMVESKLL